MCSRKGDSSSLSQGFAEAHRPAAPQGKGGLCLLVLRVAEFPAHSLNTRRMNPLLVTPLSLVFTVEVTLQEH